MENSSKSEDEKKKEKDALLTIAAERINEWMKEGWPALHTVASDKIKVTKLMTNLQVKIDDSKFDEELDDWFVYQYMLLVQKLNINLTKI